MGVFSKHKAMSEPIQDKRQIVCIGGHKIDGVHPTIDPSILEVQNKELIGRECDCRRFIYSEVDCGCPFNKYWKIEWEQNANY